MYCGEVQLDQVIGFCDRTGCVLLYPEEAEELARMHRELEELYRRKEVAPHELKVVVARAAELLRKLF